MAGLKFIWDDAKADINIRKHGLSLWEAALVFNDPFCITEQDRIENGEYRWQSIGQIRDNLVILVAHTYLDEDEVVVRLISARKAARSERKRYENETR